MRRIAYLTNWKRPALNYRGWKEGDKFLSKGKSHVYTLYSFETAREMRCELGCLKREKDFGDSAWVLISDNCDAAEWVGSYVDFTIYYKPMK